MQVEAKNASVAVVVTPSDSTVLALATRTLYIGVSGDVKVDMASSGTAIVFKAVPVGFLYVSVVKVYSTGTTATNIVALY